MNPDELTDVLLNRNDWTQLQELIQTAECTDFTPEQSKKLAPRLLQLAIQHRDETGHKPVAIWSAIRTGASMLYPSQAHQLEPLFAPGSHVDTTMTSVKMLGRIFEAQPPKKKDQYQDLSDDMRYIANCLLNEYSIASSQCAALAQLSIYALAAMASSQTIDVVTTVKNLGISWFAQQMHFELKELRGYWSGNPRVAPDEPRKLLEQAIQVLA